MSEQEATDESTSMRDSGTISGAIAAEGSWNRWVTLVAGMFLMLSAGCPFSFGSIGGQVKEALGATEAEQQLIGVAGNCGLWTNVVGGLLYEKFGARPTVLLGGLLASSGCAVLWMALQLKAPPAVAALGWFAAGHGSGWIYISTLVANLSNFHPSERGFVVGTMACFFGASSAVLVSLLGGCLGGHFEDGACQGGFMGGSVQTYVGYLAVAIPATVVPAALLTSVAKKEPMKSPESEGVARRFGLVAALTMLLVAVISGSNLFAVLKDVSVRTWANYVMFTLLCLLLLVPVGTGSCWKGAAFAEAESSEDQTAFSRPVNASSPAPVAFTPGEATRTPKFWFMWAAFGLTVGGDITTLNFMPSIASSRSLGPEVPQLCVIIAMSCDTATRFGAGSAVSRGAPFLALMVCGPLLLILAQATFACGGQGGAPLYAASALLGTSDGVMWSLGPLFVGKSFGLRSAGRIFGLVVLAAAICTLFLSLVVEPRVYQAHAAADGTCSGPECFLMTHGVITLFGILAACCVLALMR